MSKFFIKSLAVLASPAFLIKTTLYILVAALLFACTGNPGETTEEKIDYLVQERFEDHDFIGNVLVADNGKILYKKSFGNADHAHNVANTDSSRFLIASLSKPLTAILILRLADKNMIGLKDNVSAYFKLSNTRIGAITIHQLLTHTSGINEFINKEPEMKVSTLLEKATLNFEPGSSFEYSNALLKEIAETACRKTYSQLLQEEIFDVAGMTSSGVAGNAGAPTHVTGYADASQAKIATIDFPLKNVDGAGSIYSTTQDLYALDRALYARELLSDTMRACMLKQHVPGRYSYGWYVRERGGVWDVYWQQGNLPGFTSYMSRRVEKNQVIILLANAEEVDLADLEQDIARVLKED
jgi:CubicO group peptidase (beta-lactamase class C family)